jgi:heme exporter protein B
MNKVIPIFKKEILTEFRSRHSVNTILLFILTSVAMVAIAQSNNIISNETSAGLLWIIIFFGSMVGLSKVFIAEEEKGTSLLLQLISNSHSVYLGKLLYNILLSLFINLFSVGLFFLFVAHNSLKSGDLLILTIILSSIAIATTTTVISSIIAKANSKNALFPILSFPILLPIIKLGIDLTVASYYGTSLSEIANDLQMIIAYIGIIGAVSYLLFEIIWND